ncbi:MAG: flagellar biosynthetic protein FliO [Alphaproteobacteria bacterium]|nr:flagellar biosynthetic protein FliO [Alphaproteobacteria bacterium]MBU0797034.1 flagellar biosynthetic protein FliO [Alphaproteobacteria bacterium]MBU0886560.1 flagellar biosynthetic protein FliO [Alphaproteobacteria bacterium]MBU1814148.1 flagellar biosynthetic protein FliO [Alphaproteobacteria bacterium]MBU2089962.1 flagellar biosynthetic protein FliO [Alphaproteobacteria bacterium]
MSIENYLYAVLALVFVLALLGLLFLAMRRFGIGGATPRARGQRRRLSLIEVLPVDAKRRLVLLSRDGREHLVLLGAENDLLIESLGVGEEASQRDDGPGFADIPSGVKPTPAVSGKREPAFGAAMAKADSRPAERPAGRLEEPVFGTPKDRRP